MKKIKDIIINFIKKIDEEECKRVKYNGESMLTSETITAQRKFHKSRHPEYPFKNNSSKKE